MEIQDYAFGRILIDGVTYNKDILIKDKVVIPDWQRKKGHDLSIDDLEEILKVPTHPETLIIGTGKSGVMRVSEDVVSYLEMRGIEVFVRDTPEACNLFNIESEKGTYLCAGFHLTC